MPDLKQRRQRVRRSAAVAASGLLASLLFAFQPPAASEPVNPSDQQIAQAEAQRRADAAALGKLTGQIAVLDGQIIRLGEEVDAKIAKYNATTRALQVAAEELDRAEAELAQAKKDAAIEKTTLGVILRQQYISGGNATMTTMFTSKDPFDVLVASDLQRYAGRAQKTIIDKALRQTVLLSNAEAKRRAAVAKAEQLQKQASKEKDEALAQMAAFRAKKAEMDVKRAALARQAAAASARLNGLKDQRRAYEVWQEAERKRQAAEAARRERARQEQLRQERERAEREARDRANNNQPPAPPSYTPPPASGNWGLPIARGQYSVSSCFCFRWGTFHYGTDLAAGFGTPIYAVSSGTVVAAGGAQGFGNWVVIDHGDGSNSVYGHMRVLEAWQGQHVNRGDLIAYVGSEGQSTGPHLHLEIRLGGINGEKIDPEVFLAQRGVYL